MNIRSITTTILLLTVATHGYALDPRQESERERRRSLPQPAVTPRSNPLPANLTERQTGRRRDNQGIGEAPSGFTSPQTISIDLLKLQSDTLTEYQFEPVPTMTLQGAESSQVQSSAQSEATGEEPRQEQNETDADGPSPEQSIEEIVESAPEPPEDVSVSEKLVTIGGGSSFRILEDNNRIIVTQGDTAQTAVGTVR
jgi:hypothetical protein